MTPRDWKELDRLLVEACADMIADGAEDVRIEIELTVAGPKVVVVRGGERVRAKSVEQAWGEMASGE